MHGFSVKKAEEGQSYYRLGPDVAIVTLNRTLEHAGNLHLEQL